MNKYMSENVPTIKKIRIQNMLMSTLTLREFLPGDNERKQKLQIDRHKDTQKSWAFVYRIL